MTVEAETDPEKSPRERELESALEQIRDAHPTGSSWTHMHDGTWREAFRDAQRIARAALGRQA